MKKLSILGLFALSLFACESKKEGNDMEELKTKTVTEGKYTYTTVEGDPMETRVYTLDNGLKVYLTVYKDAPRIQTYIPIRAGSKNDPADATGLAHYLEHMVFKGTSEIGALNWEKEKPLLDEIEQLYEQYRQTDDEEERARIYAQIDSVSGIAAQYVAANEYDKIVSNFGAKGTNAYTSNAMMIAVESGPEKSGQWQTVRRNIVEDYRRAFGEDPPKVGAIAIMTDTDNTGEHAVAWYDDIAARSE